MTDISSKIFVSRNYNTEQTQVEQIHNQFNQKIILLMYLAFFLQIPHTASGVLKSNSETYLVHQWCLKLRQTLNLKTCALKYLLKSSSFFAFKVQIL